MEISGCPGCGRGYRNIFCPLYRGCLDLAIRKNWMTWNCSLCPFKKMKRPVHEYDFPTGLSAFVNESPFKF
ncbi:MAG TPA: hypothetical protein HPP90_10105 [Deltaproteobacteria bacterium]|nr:hypothetical protein [Deltaproteobacteria bacterium]